MDYSILLNDYVWPLILIVLKILIVVIPLIVAVAYLTYFERKVIGAIQMRQGPMVTGPFGLLQPIADAVKLMFKEPIIPALASKPVFVAAPMITFVLAIIGWAVIPFSEEGAIANINVGVLYLLATSSLGVYGIIMSGWASNSKYAFLGAIRSSAQMISYEISMGLVIVTILLAVGSMDLTDIVLSGQNFPWYLDLLLFPMAVVFFISILAETNRLPFDLPEAESELVAGYNVEYSSIAFALFFLGEYANMILTSTMLVVLFMGGWFPPFGIKFLSFVPGIIWFALKVAFILFCFLWVRGTFPRYRYDQLMRLGWKILLPFSLFYVVFMASFLKYMDLLPS